MPILGIIASSISGNLDAGDFESIATVSVGSGGSSTITFSSIPATFTHLQVRGIVRSSLASTAAGFIMRVNSDSGSNYSAHNLGGDGSSTQANAYVSNTYMYPGPAMPAASTTASIFGTMVIDLLDYANTNKYKTMRALSGYDSNGSGQIYFNSASWRNTNAITNLSLLFTSSDCVQYSQFALYGIRT